MSLNQPETTLDAEGDVIMTAVASNGAVGGKAAAPPNTTASAGVAALQPLRMQQDDKDQDAPSSRKMQPANKKQQQQQKKKGTTKAAVPAPEETLSPTASSEKHAYAAATAAAASGSTQQHPNDGYCCVCTVNGVSVEGEDFDDVIVFCGKCDVAVHVSCYGNPLVHGIPEDDWICGRCQAGATDAACVLCPVKGGAMKRTTDWKWVHLSCALWIPEVFFRYGEGREPIDYQQLYVKRSSWNRKCCHCQSTMGVCLECSDSRCKKTFHVTCGMRNNIFLEYKTNTKGADVIVSYCQKHSSQWRGAKKRASVIVAAGPETKYKISE